MKPLTDEWVNKAEGDLACVRRELRARKAPNYDAACFHAQQCAEKYLKARLQEESIPFPRTHDLTALLALLLPIEPGWAVFSLAWGDLTDYAVRYRYPGETATRNDARRALNLCREVRERVRASLGLPI